VHSILHCFDGGRADAIELQYLLLSQDVAKPLHRCVLVKVGNSVRVLDLDIADGTVAARNKVGVEAYKRLRPTVFLGDVDAHAEMFVVFGRDQLYIFQDSHLDFFIAVRVEWFLGPFGRLEGGFLSAVLLFLCDSAESPCLINLALRNNSRVWANAIVSISLALSSSIVASCKSASLW